MGGALTIVMYHYVRDLAGSRYPEIKGLTVDRFRGQLEFLRRHFALVGRAEILAAIRGDADLPPRAAVLTFDDGYVDHVQTVFPLLHDRGIEGMFFPPVRAIRDRRLLAVNKIHFLLAATRDPRLLVDAIGDEIERHRAAYGLKTAAEYESEHRHPGRLDPAEIVFIKRMLQSALPGALRNRIVDDLFRRHVTADEAGFAAELYATEDQLRLMARSGMYIGSHGSSHDWMDRLDPARQAQEIEESLAFLAAIGAPTEDWVMCYPHGAHSPALCDALQRRGCAVGLTTRMAIADLAIDDKLLLPRLDTNYLPMTADAPAWTWDSAGPFRFPARSS